MVYWILTLGVLISYFIGAIPTAYIFGRILKGIDIRKFGSGNVGATNALRVLGKGPGITILLLDMLKGFVAVVFLANLLIPRCEGIPELTARILLGLSCIIGHNWTIYLRFKGGKGMATSLGVLLGLSLEVAGLKIIFALIILTWLVIFLITRIVSLASVLAGISLPVYIFLFNPAQSRKLLFLSFPLSLFILLRHKDNLKRIFQGKEPRLMSR